MLLAALGAVAFLFVVVPHYWKWDAYPSRDFSTPERLLTQGRVLSMYLWEILVPLPRHMPFYYDWLQPSRGLLDPWTTLPALLLVFALAGDGMLAAQAQAAVCTGRVSVLRRPLRHQQCGGPGAGLRASQPFRDDRHRARGRRPACACRAAPAPSPTGRKSPQSRCCWCCLPAPPWCAP